MVNKRQVQAVERVRARAAEVKAARAAEAKATARVRAAIVAARKAGVPVPVVAEAAGVSRGRVSQIMGEDEAPGHGADAQKDGQPSVRVADSGTPAIPADTFTGSRLSGLASVRERVAYGRATMFYDVATGAACMDSGAIVPGDSGADAGRLADVLAAVQAAAPAEVARVYLTGPTPFAPEQGATRAEGVRGWALSEPAPGWATSPRGHYLGDPAKPVLRFYRVETGQTVTVMRAASWWGETGEPVEVCAAAWRGLERLLDDVRAFRGAGLADTPATTGRALWARTIPASGSYPVLSDEMRGLIAATAGQGRIELLPAAAPQVERFTYLDGRLMYAALTWGMPVGEPVMVSGADFARMGETQAVAALRGRGRWRVTATVPEGWRHVGLLMAPGDGPERGGWVYPRDPGQRFTTWADGSEVWMARQSGWRVDVHEGFTWAEGKPLNAWRDALVAAWERARANGSPAALLTARALRSILLFAIGAFAAREHPTTGTVPVDRPDLVPEQADPSTVRQVGDHLVYTMPGRLSPWSARMAHPEWAALVWARARTRLTTAALQVPFQSVIGFATDALYLDGDPGWPDDGAPGRFRVKGRIDTPSVWPAGRAELYALTDAAERNLDG